MPKAVPAAAPSSMTRRSPSPVGADDALIAIAWAAGLTFSVIAIEILGFHLGFRMKWMPLLLVAIVVIARRPDHFRAFLPYVNPGMLVILTWMLLSALWAPNLVFALTQGVSIVGVSALAMAFSMAGWHEHRFEQVMTVTVTTLLVLSLLVALAFPAVGVHSDHYSSLLGSWRGVTGQKNFLGQLSVVGMILWSYRWAARRSNAFVALAGVGLCMLLLVKSRSSTSLMLGLISCFTMLLILRPMVSAGGFARRAIMLGLALLIPVAIYLAVSTSFFEPIGAFFGKDGTFTGRKYIWDEVLVEIRQHPWFGIGFASFWGGLESPAARIILKLQWAVPSGHNGYLDIANEMGVIGLLFFLFFLFCHCLGLARLAKVSPVHYGLHLPLFMYVVLANTSESGWFRPIELTHLIGMYTSLEVSRQLFAHAQRVRRRRRQAEPSAERTAGAPIAQGTGLGPNGPRRLPGR